VELVPVTKISFPLSASPETNFSVLKRVAVSTAAKSSTAEGTFFSILERKPIAMKMANANFEENILNFQMIK
jgi:hypothetical protein